MLGVRNWILPGEVSKKNKGAALSGLKKRFPDFLSFNCFFPNSMFSVEDLFPGLSNPIRAHPRPTTSVGKYGMRAQFFSEFERWPGRLRA
jgi:hypothetical protein